MQPVFTQPIFLNMLTLILWVIVPLLPSILLYRIFPGNPLTAEGPFAGLTIRASGAVALYLVIFAGIYYPVHQNFMQIELQRTADTAGYWRVFVPIRVNGGAPTSDIIDSMEQNLKVEYRPNSLALRSGGVWVWVRHSKDDGFPFLNFSINDKTNGIWGGGTLDMSKWDRPQDFDHLVTDAHEFDWPKSVNMTIQRNAKPDTKPAPITF